ncbi:hypothetical protein A9Q02_03650 [Candidatus Chloroploca asiatica]|uniref:Uncharacterized protein n=1 Tax=Candidatus Chloroploca asiatica TaxID=1506545 RepID=A0A2H3KI80_9CHLR|nr:hypothetical protein A9Q02_03650 [Candidatus Chloroploca asiatica]
MPASIGRHRRAFQAQSKKELTQLFFRVDMKMIPTPEKKLYIQAMEVAIKLQASKLVISFLPAGIWHLFTANFVDYQFA